MGIGFGREGEGIMVSRIISGGQSGVDRAALDVAIDLDIPHGGWVPKGRKAEDGVIPEKYRMKESPDGGYAGRTERNVIDSDGTLIISRGRLSGGSALTREFAARHGRPWIHIDINTTNAFEAAKTIKIWAARRGIETLNVAGPRASQDPGIYRAAEQILKTFLSLEWKRLRETHILKNVK